MDAKFVLVCVLGLWVALGGSALAGAPAPITLDFDFDGGGGPTQDSWIGIRSAQNFADGTQLSGPDDGLPPGVEAGFGQSTGSERNRGPNDDNLPGAGATRGVIEGVNYTDLLRDYVAIEGDANTPGFKVTGLPPGEYTVWVIGGDISWGGQNAPYDMTVNGVLWEDHPGYPSENPDGDPDVTDSINMVGPNPNHPDNWSITMADELTLVWPDPIELYNDIRDRARIAGVRIIQAPPPVEPIPEPAGLSLVGLALLAVRRKRS